MTRSGISPLFDRVFLQVSAEPCYTPSLCLWTYLARGLVNAFTSCFVKRKRGCCAAASLWRLSLAVAPCSQICQIIVLQKGLAHVLSCVSLSSARATRSYAPSPRGPRSTSWAESFSHLSQAPHAKLGRKRQMHLHHHTPTCLFDAAPSYRKAS